MLREFQQHLQFNLRVTKQNRCYRFISFLILSLIFNACAFQQYTANPVDPTTSANAFNSRTIDDPAFYEFLAQQTNQTIPNPIKKWRLDTLIYTAHFFHPDLTVARAELNAATLTESNAQRRPLPTINAGISRSDQANGDINPFAYNFSIDLPINTANKQAIRINHFTHLSNIAKLNIAQAAWQIRQNVANAFILLHEHALTAELLNDELNAHQKVVKLIEKRMAYGEASNIELSNAKHQLANSKTALITHQQQLLPLKAQLAKALGLPLKSVYTMKFDFNGLATPFDKTSSLKAPDIVTAQEKALLNRIDIRLALEAYAIAENALKLEIAKQYPDIILSPGYSYEFGDKVWSLGFSSLMALIEKNKANIALAEQLRTVEKAKFDQLQANIMAEVNARSIEFESARISLEAQHHLYEQQIAHLKQRQRQFDAGMIDRLTLTLANLALIDAKRTVISATHSLNMAKNQLENTLQQPL